MLFCVYRTWKTLVNLQHLQKLFRVKSNVWAMFQVAKLANVFIKISKWRNKQLVFNIKNNLVQLLVYSILMDSGLAIITIPWVGKVVFWALISINIPKGAAVAAVPWNYLNIDAYMRNYINPILDESQKALPPSSPAFPL